MSYPRSVSADWSKDQRHLLFTFDDGNPETDYFYYIPKGELIGTEHDRIDWMRHLNSKAWFTPIKQKVLKMIEEAK